MGNQSIEPVGGPLHRRSVIERTLILCGLLAKPPFLLSCARARGTESAPETTSLAVALDIVRSAAEFYEWASGQLVGADYSVALLNRRTAAMMPGIIAEKYKHRVALERHIASAAGRRGGIEKIAPVSVDPPIEKLKGRIGGLHSPKGEYFFIAIACDLEDVALRCMREFSANEHDPLAKSLFDDGAALANFHGALFATL